MLARNAGRRAVWTAPIKALVAEKFFDLVERRSGRSVTAVTAVDRPTPLYHQWRMTSVADSVLEAVKEGLSPVYVVHANQAAAIERAQALVSMSVTTRTQREAIVAAMAGEKLRRGFGVTLDRLIRNGVGVHHAGMLPRYRRLVERLAGAGLLPVIPRPAMTEDVVDHLVDTDLDIGPREEVVHDPLSRDPVAGMTASALSETLRVVGLTSSGQGEPRPCLLDDGRCLRPRRDHVSNRWRPDQETSTWNQAQAPQVIVT